MLFLETITNFRPKFEFFQKMNPKPFNTQFIKAHTFHPAAANKEGA